jgi:putative FmdB family regulatory protein
MPTYEYECERCKRVFEVERKISEAPLTTCALLDARSRLERFNAFNHAGGALTWNGRSFADHPDRCVCQGTDDLPHRHYDDSHKGFGGCARCGCVEYTPAFTPACEGSVRRLISGGTSFALKGPGWAKDGYR